MNGLCVSTLFRIVYITVSQFINTMEIINSIITEEIKILFYTLKVPNCCSETAEYNILLLFLLFRISFIQPTNKLQHIQKFNEFSENTIISFSISNVTL